MEELVEAVYDILEEDIEEALNGEYTPSEVIRKVLAPYVKDVLARLVASQISLKDLIPDISMERYDHYHRDDDYDDYLPQDIRASKVAGRDEDGNWQRNWKP